VTRGGYIALGEKEKSKALEFLNEIMSTLLVLDTAVHVIRENDLDEVTFTEHGHRVHGSTTSLRSLLVTHTGATIIPKEKMIKAIKWAETLTLDVRLKTLLLLSLEFHTHLANSEYKQALVMGWVILEDFHIKDTWASEIAKVTSDQDRISKLGSWDIDRKLEALNISHVLTNDQYDLLMRIKDARNKTVHEGKEPAREIVEECSRLVSDVTQKRVGTGLGSMASRL